MKCRATALGLIAIILIALPVYAFVYSATVTVVENGAASFNMTALGFNSNNQYMADNGFMSATGLDTRVETPGGVELPHLTADNATYFATPISQNGQLNLLYTLQNPLLSFYHMVFGSGGFFSVSDSADIEPGDNFTITETVYLGSSGTVAVKPGAISISYNMVTENVTASIVSGSQLFQSQQTQNADDGMGGVWWFAQTFTPAVTHNIERVEVYASRSSGSGDGTAAIRNTLLGKPTGADLIAKTQSVAGWSSATWQSFTFDSTIELQAGTQYALLLSTDTASVRWNRINSNAYPGGSRISSGDSGVNWVIDASRDMTFREYGEGFDSVSVASVAVGERTIIAQADSSNWWITVDGSASANNTAISVPDTSTDWVFGGSATPYAVNITIAKGGAEISQYAPNAVILGTTLPDEIGSNTGNITWGANPASVNVTLGSLVSTSTPVPGGGLETPTTDILPETESSDWFKEPDVSGTLLTNPLRPLVTILSNTTTLTESQAWILYALALIFLTTVGAAMAVKGHLLVSGIVAAVGFGGAVALTIFPLWALVFVIGAVLGGIVAERSPSL